MTAFCRPEHKHLLDPKRPWRTQVRYVGAVCSLKEFAELLHLTVGQIQRYTSITGNEVEVKKALANPHTLVFIRVV